MSKFRVFDDKEAEPITYLKLVQDHDNVKLIAVDDDGTIVSNILSFTKNGYLYLNACVRQDLGFKLDNDGRLIIKDM
jgi:hypothetical protein